MDLARFNGELLSHLVMKGNVSAILKEINSCLEKIDVG
jgi:hypothetical protein